MVAVPTPVPTTAPVADATVATPVLLLLHVPPLVESLKANPEPWQIGPVLPSTGFVELVRMYTFLTLWVL